MPGRFAVVAIAAWALQQGRDAGAFKSARGAQIDLRIVGRFRYSDLGVGGGYAPFRGCDVRASFQKFRRDGDRNLRRRCGQRQRRKIELRGRLPDKYCDGVLVLRAEHAHINRRCPGSLQLSPRLLDFYFRRDSSVEKVQVQIQGIFVSFNRCVQQLFLGIEAARLKIIDGERRVHAQIDGRQICGASLRLFSIRLHGASHSPPDVHLIGKVERHCVVVLSQANSACSRKWPIG